MPAPFVPSSDEINAESTEDIGVIDDRKFAKVKLTEEFQAQMEPFHFKSIASLQQEMVEILKKVDEGINFEKFSAQVECLRLVVCVLFRVRAHMPWLPRVRVS